MSANPSPHAIWETATIPAGESLVQYIEGNRYIVVLIDTIASVKNKWFQLELT